MIRSRHAAWDFVSWSQARAAKLRFELRCTDRMASIRTPEYGRGSSSLVILLSSAAWLVLSTASNSASLQPGMDRDDWILALLNDLLQEPDPRQAQGFWVHEVTASGWLLGGVQERTGPLLSLVIAQHIKALCSDGQHVPRN